MFDLATKFQEYREKLHGLLRYRADAIFNLLDSLSGRQSAQSVVELSLEVPFERRHSSLYDSSFAYFVSQFGKFTLRDTTETVTGALLTPKFVPKRLAAAIVGCININNTNHPQDNPPTQPQHHFGGRLG